MSPNNKRVGTARNDLGTATQAAVEGKGTESTREPVLVGASTSRVEPDKGAMTARCYLEDDAPRTEPLPLAKKGQKHLRPVGTYLAPMMYGPLGPERGNLPIFGTKEVPDTIRLSERERQNTVMVLVDASFGGEKDYAWIRVNRTDVTLEPPANYKAAKPQITTLKSTEMLEGLQEVASSYLKPPSHWDGRLGRTVSEPISVLWPNMDKRANLPGAQVVILACGHMGANEVHGYVLESLQDRDRLRERLPEVIGKARAGAYFAEFMLVRESEGKLLAEKLDPPTVGTAVEKVEKALAQDPPPHIARARAIHAQFSAIAEFDPLLFRHYRVDLRSDLKALEGVETGDKLIWIPRSMGSYLGPQGDPRSSINVVLRERIEGRSTEYTRCFGVEVTTTGANIRELSWEDAYKLAGGAAPNGTVERLASPVSFGFDGKMTRTEAGHHYEGNPEEQAWRRGQVSRTAGQELSAYAYVLSESAIRWEKLMAKALADNAPIAMKDGDAPTPEAEAYERHLLAQEAHKKASQEGGKFRGVHQQLSDQHGHRAEAFKTLMAEPRR